MPFLYLEAPAVAASLYNQRQLLSGSTSSTSLLLSSGYDKDRDSDRECRRKYEEVYRAIEQNRRDLDNDDNERDHRRHQQNLERDFRKLQDLRDRYSDCDNRNYRNDRDRDYNRNYRNDRDRDYNRNYRDDRDRDYNRNYRDYPPVAVPVRPLPPRYPE